jgi:hypothetical protein
VNSFSRLRTAAFVLVAFAALASLISRIAIAGSGEGLVAFAGVQSLDLPIGQPIGQAIFDGIVGEPFPSVRLRVSQCVDPIFVTAMPLKSVAVAEFTDRAYLDHPGYTATSVYRGKVRPHFSHFFRLFARNPLEPYNLDTGYFVRFYAPANCVIDTQAYVEWARLILPLASKQPASGAGD